jgi:hypothetical protein
VGGVEVEEIGVDPPYLVDQRRPGVPGADQPGLDPDAGLAPRNPGALEQRAALRLLALHAALERQLVGDLEHVLR